MRTDLSEFARRAGAMGSVIAVWVLAAVPSAAQTPPRPADPAPAAPPVIACASLANLRTVLRGANDDTAAAIPVITDPKSDLGCNLLDRKAVTGIADHVALNGRAYDCLSLQTTNVCQWTVAGAATPASAAQPPVRQPQPAPAPGKARR